MSSLKTRARETGDIVLSLPPINSVAKWANRRKLRVLAYHGVDNPETFDRQMAHVCDQYKPVSATDVAATLKGEHVLPDNAVWVTFDDGYPSVVQNAMDVLRARSVEATVFVCPSVIDTTDPLWWQLVDQCARNDIFPEGHASVAGVVSALKSLDDDTRTLQIDSLWRRLKDTLGHDPQQPQLTTNDLVSMRSAGHTIGNHTWTHPLLNRCTPAAQREQIVRAHDWFQSHLGVKMSMFAYPNGNYTSYSETVLDELGYDIAALFDHRVSSPTSPHLQISRLRVSDANSLRRFAAIISGTHPFVNHIRTRT